MRNLFAHTFRLLIVVVLATVALGLLGTAVSASRFDAASARLESVYTFDERYVVQGKLYPLSQDDLALLTDTGRPFSLCASNGGIAPTFTAFLDPESTTYGTTGALYDAPYYVIAADEAALQEAGTTVIGRLPAQRNEVALSMCQFRLFLENGYYDNIASPIRIDYETGTLVYDRGYVYPVTDAASFIREARRITLRDYAASDEAAGEYAELEATIVGIVDYGECPYEHAMNGTSVSHGIDYYDAIYLDGQRGNDDWLGASCQYPVKTFARAKELLNQEMETSKEARQKAAEEGKDPSAIAIPTKIYICGTVEITGTENWTLPGYTDYDDTTQIQVEIVSHTANIATDKEGNPVHELPASLVSVSGNEDLTLEDGIVR